MRIPCCLGRRHLCRIGSDKNQQEDLKWQNFRKELEQEIDWGRRFQRRSQMNFEEMEQQISDYAKAHHVVLDYTAQSIEVLDEIMETFHERVNQCSEEEGDEILAEWAACFGVYIGETLLRVHLSEKGFAWALNGEIPVLQRGNDRLEPIYQACIRIRYGCAFDIDTFYQRAVWTADQTPFSAERVVDVELVEAEYHEKNVLYEDIETLLLAVVNGEEEYMILRSRDGFLQFFGMNDKFVAETRVNLPDGDFRTYSIINKERKQAMDKITVHTMLDKSEVPACEVISLEMLRAAVRAYYSNGYYESFLKQTPHMDTTEQTKRYMGLIK